MTTKRSVDLVPGILTERNQSRDWRLWVNVGAIVLQFLLTYGFFHVLHMFYDRQLSRLSLSEFFDRWYFEVLLALAMVALPTLYHFFVERFLLNRLKGSYAQNVQMMARLQAQAMSNFDALSHNLAEVPVFNDVLRAHLVQVAQSTEEAAGHIADVHGYGHCAVPSRGDSAPSTIPHA